MRKICVVISARPSYSRIKTALRAIEDNPKLELQIVLAASSFISRFGDLSSTILKDGFRITTKAMTLVDGESCESMAKTTGLGIIELSSIFSFYKPDAVITIADRYETISTAIAASYMNIPLIHIQGGEITGNIDEKVRHAITKLADIHFVSNQEARSNVIRMGEVEEMVINTGCPSIDLAKESLSLPSINLPEAISRYGGVGAPLNSSEDYIIVMQHPVTTEYSESLKQIQATIGAVDEIGMQAVWLWPNPDAGSDGTSKGIRTFREKNPNNRIHFFKNMEPEAFLQLLRSAKCIVGNSSVAIRECSFLGVPAVNIGTRQANRLRGKNVLDVSYRKSQIKEAIKTQIAKAGSLGCDRIYGDGKAGVRIAEHCVSMELKSSKYLSY